MISIAATAFLMRRTVRYVRGECLWKRNAKDKKFQSGAKSAKVSPRPETGGGKANAELKTVKSKATTDRKIGATTVNSQSKSAGDQMSIELKVVKRKPAAGSIRMNNIYIDLEKGNRPAATAQ